MFIAIGLVFGHIQSSNCNRGLGLLNDDEATLQNLIEYLNA